MKFPVSTPEKKAAVTSDDNEPDSDSDLASESDADVDAELSVHLKEPPKAVEPNWRLRKPEDQPYVGDHTHPDFFNACVQERESRVTRTDSKSQG